MAKITTQIALESLRLSGQMEDFGPNSKNPYLAIDLSDLNSEFSKWLTQLPCPVIGIGTGPLSDHVDVHIHDTKPLKKIVRNIEAAPFASMILVQHLRASEMQSSAHALTAESLAYATLQDGPEFTDWNKNTLKSAPLPTAQNDLLTEVAGNILSLTFNRPDTRNAIGTDMRDALCNALNIAILDPSISKVYLTGNGPTFSTGGAVEEFGEVSDPTTAHWIRSLRLPASKILQIQDKLHVHVNGAAIGAGVEIAAFGQSVTASSRAWFQLPELKYGLIPGAGGTVSLPRRIGRQKTGYLAFSMEKIRANTALDWGLIDAIKD